MRKLNATCNFSIVYNLCVPLCVLVLSFPSFLCFFFIGFYFFLLIFSCKFSCKLVKNVSCRGWNKQIASVSLIVTSNAYTIYNSYVFHLAINLVELGCIELSYTCAKFHLYNSVMTRNYDKYSKNIMCIYNWTIESAHWGLNKVGAE